MRPNSTASPNCSCPANPLASAQTSQEMFLIHVPMWPRQNICWGTGRRFLLKKENSGEYVDSKDLFLYSLIAFRTMFVLLRSQRNMSSRFPRQSVVALLIRYCSCLTIEKKSCFCIALLQILTNSMKIIFFVTNDIFTFHNLGI